MKTIMLASVLTAMTGVAAMADSGNDVSSDCALNRPIRVLNAETGNYESLRTRTDRGWCQWSQDRIDDGTWEPENDGSGADASASDSSRSDGGSESAY
jgi:hypothetical protein